MSVARRYPRGRRRAIATLSVELRMSITDHDHSGNKCGQRSAFCMVARITRNCDSVDIVRCVAPLWQRRAVDTHHAVVVGRTCVLSAAVDIFRTRPGTER